MSVTTLSFAPSRARPGASRLVIVAALLTGAAAGVAVGAQTGAAGGDADLLRLLRAMAVLKLLFVAAASAALLWRLQSPVSPMRLGAYAVACAAMAAGPGLLWTMSHVGLAAVLLHGGVAATVLLLWQDPASSDLLDATIIRRRLAR